MFATSGYFRGVDCPYYASGLCERPYCHLRHVRLDEKDSKSGVEEESNTPKSNDATNLLSLVGNAIKQVQKDIEMDQARLQNPTEAESPQPTRQPSVEAAPTNSLLQQSTSNLTTNYPYNQAKYTLIKPQKPKVHASKNGQQRAPSNHLKLEYNPTPIKELEKKNKVRKDEKHDSSHSSVRNSAKSVKRKSTESKRKAKRPRKEPPPRQVAEALSEEEELKAPDFSDLEDSEEELSKVEDSEADNKKKEKKSAVNDEPGNRTKSKENQSSTSEFDVFEKSGRKCSKSLNLLPVDDILGVSTKESSKVKCSSSKSRSEKHKSSKTTTKETEKSIALSKKTDENIFAKFLGSEKLKAAAQKVIDSEATESAQHPKIKTELCLSTETDKHKNGHEHSSSKHKHSSKDREHKHRRSSGQKEKSRSSDKLESSAKKPKRESEESETKHSKESKSKDSHKNHSEKSHHHHHKHKKHSRSSSSHRRSSSSSGSQHKHHSSSKHKTSRDKDSKKVRSAEVRLKRQVSESDLFGKESDSEGASSEVEVIPVKKEKQEVVEVIDSSDEDAPDLSDVELDQESTEVGDQPDVHDHNVGQNKKRVAHAQASSSSSKKNSVPSSHRKLSPSEVMHNRFLELQKRAAQAVQAVQEAAHDLKSVKTPPVKSCSLGLEKRRSSSVGTPKPFLGSETLAKKPIFPTNPTIKDDGSKKPVSTTKATLKEEDRFIVTTQKKGSSRVAHIPNVAVLKKPTIPAEYGSKVPSNIRQRYLNQFVDECLRIYPDQQDAFDRALAEEKAAYERSSSRVVYLNVAVNTIKKLRSESPREPGPAEDLQGNKSPVSTSKQKAALSHAAVLGGAKATKITYTLHRSKGMTIKIPDKFVGVDLYNRMNWFVMSEDLLVSNGFPRLDPDKINSVIIYQETPRARSNNPNEKVCARCGKLFQVTAAGQYVSKEACNYHWGKCWKRKVAGQLDTRWTCCQEYSSAKGCTLAPLHVFDQNKYDNLEGYVKTFPHSPPADGDYKVYALDCEMIYTTGGNELARVSVVNANLEAAYETLVKPQNHIVDYNTRFSGLTDKDLKHVKTTLADVQETLLGMFSDKTILIGHSLESDLIALKMVHDTVVDTSVVFPHRMGPPLKRALQTLMVEILQKIIQNDVGGHDSKEDAASCMQLMMWKLKEDAKKAARK